jgi:large subunit ribosomal protein L25
MSTASKDILAVESRTKTGTTAAHALRRDGKIPGILFGHGAPPLPIAFTARSLDDLLHGGAKSHLLAITIDGTTKDTALLRDLQRDPITRRITHADLQRVSATESIHALLRVVAVGVAQGVRESGAVLDVVFHELEVQGPANALPEKIEIDVTQLRVHDQVTAAQVQLPAGFKMLTPPETVIITIEASRTAGDVEAAAPAPAEVPTVAETKTDAKDAKAETKQGGKS